MLRKIARHLGFRSIKAARVNRLDLIPNCTSIPAGASPCPKERGQGGTSGTGFTPPNPLRPLHGSTLVGPSPRHVSGRGLYYPRPGEQGWGRVGLRHGREWRASGVASSPCLSCPASLPPSMPPSHPSPCPALPSLPVLCPPPSSVRRGHPLPVLGWSVLPPSSGPFPLFPSGGRVRGEGRRALPCACRPLPPLGLWPARALPCLCLSCLVLRAVVLGRRVLWPALPGRGGVVGVGGLAGLRLAAWRGRLRSTWVFTLTTLLGGSRRRRDLLGCAGIALTLPRAWAGS